MSVSNRYKINWMNHSINFIIYLIIILRVAGLYTFDNSGKQTSGLYRLRVRFFTTIQEWILKSKSKRIRKWILRFFTKQINPWSDLCIKGTEESTSRVVSSVPLTHHDQRDLGLICLVKKRKICFRILSHLSWIRELKQACFWDVDSNRKRIFCVLLGPYCLPDFYTTLYL